MKRFEPDIDSEIIIGSGPEGPTATIYESRAKLESLIIPSTLLTNGSMPLSSLKY